MPTDAEELRRRLYRPGVSDEDVAAYTRTLQAAEPAPAEDPEQVAPPRGRRVVPVAVGSVVVVALLGAVLMQSPALRSGDPSPSPTAPTVAFVEATPGELPVVFDRGPRAFAGGSAVTSAAYPGRFLYTVAEGDTVIGMASRFGLCRPDVQRSLPADFDWSTLQPGQSLILGRIDDDTERLLIRSGAC